MIGTTIKAMGRRGILRGALGLGAAIGVGAKRTRDGHGTIPPVGSYGQDAPSQSINSLEQPSWLDALGKAAETAEREIYRHARFDNLDLDLAMLRSPSPAYKLVVQRARDERRRVAQQSLWERFHAARKGWLRGVMS